MDPAALGTRSLVVDNDRLKIWSGPGSEAELVRDVDYMLMRVQVTDARDDIKSFSALEKLRAAMIDAYASSDEVGGDKAYRSTLAAIEVHPELIDADRNRLLTRLTSDRDQLRATKMAITRSPGGVASWASFAADLPAEADHTKFVAADHF
jgi:hypothetical protein